MDKLLIAAGLAFFFLVVLFILKQRVIDRGIRIALFWTRFIPRKAKAVESVLERANLKVTSTATSITTTMAALAVPVLRYEPRRFDLNQMLISCDSSASVVSFIDPASSSPISRMDSLSSMEPIEAITSIIVDEQPVPLGYDNPRDEL